MAQPVTDFTSVRRDLLFERIVHTLDKMPEELREIFILRHYVGKTAEEISQITGRDPSEVRALLVSSDQVFFRNLRIPVSRESWAASLAARETSSDSVHLKDHH